MQQSRVQTTDFLQQSDVELPVLKAARNDELFSGDRVCSLRMRDINILLIDINAISFYGRVIAQKLTIEFPAM